MKNYKLYYQGELFTIDFGYSEAEQDYVIEKIDGEEPHKFDNNLIEALHTELLWSLWDDEREKQEQKCEEIKERK